MPTVVALWTWPDNRRKAERSTGRPAGSWPTFPKGVGLQDRGVLLHRRRCFEAATLLKLARPAMEALGAEFPTTSEYRGDLATTTHRLGLCRSDRPEEAVVLLRDAAAGFVTARDKKSTDTRLPYYDAPCHYDLGRLLDRQGQSAAAAAEYRAGIRRAAY